MIRLNLANASFRLFGPDETASNRLDPVYTVSGKARMAETVGNAFIHIVDSMFNQHAKWPKVSRMIPWRAPIASLNILLTSHVWRQDHNGLSHQDPGFIDHVANKSSDVVRIYLPPDANCLLSVADHCLKSRHCVNVIVAGKQLSWQWLDMEARDQPSTRQRRQPGVLP